MRRRPRKLPINRTAMEGADVAVVTTAPPQAGLCCLAATDCPSIAHQPRVARCVRLVPSDVQIPKTWEKTPASASTCNPRGNALASPPLAHPLSRFVEGNRDGKSLFSPNHNSPRASNVLRLPAHCTLLQLPPSLGSQASRRTSSALGHARPQGLMASPDASPSSRE